jgi:MoaA/NifB/PqqE/SkfB family radical SAM enzyme
MGAAMQPVDIAARIARWPTEGPQGPMTLELYPTLACNLSCRFCDTTERHRAPVDELPTERLLELVEEAAEMGVKRVFILGGGEPLLRRKATPAVMARVKALGMEGVLTTNGTLLGTELSEQILTDGWDEIHFSIDGPSPEIHDRLRGVSGAFRRAVQAACRLSVGRKSRGLDYPRVALHTVITNENYQTLPDMIRLAHALGAERVDFDALIAYRPEQLALKLTVEEAARVPGIAREALELAESLGIQSTLENYLDPSAMDRGNTRVEASGGGLQGAPCLKAWHYVVVAADGKTSPCCVLASQGGSIAKESLETAWLDDPFLNRVRQGMLSGEPLPRCKECSWNILQHEARIRACLPPELPCP